MPSPPSRTFTVTAEGVYDLPASTKVDGKVSIPIELSIPAEGLLQGVIYIPDLKELAQSFAAPFENIFRLFLRPLGSWISSLIDSAIAQIKANSGPSGYAGHSVIPAMRRKTARRLLPERNSEAFPRASIDLG